MKKRNKLHLSYWIALAVGITFSYFIWTLWQKLTQFIGDSWVVIAITGGIVLIAVIFGYFSLNKLVKKFT